MSDQPGGPGQNAAPGVSAIVSTMATARKLEADTIETINVSCPI
jgi:hypothetical protein